jgi:hypothetical protein
VGFEERTIWELYGNLNYFQDKIGTVTSNNNFEFKFQKDGRASENTIPKNKRPNIMFQKDSSFST